jgi:protease-4
MSAKACLRLLFLLGALSAAGADPRFRADDGNLWHLDDNPALAAVSGDIFAAGTALNTQNVYNVQGLNEIAVVSPFISFSYSQLASDTEVRFGTTVGPWAGFSLGYKADSFGSGSSSNDFGLLWRPVDLLSAALTLDDAFGSARLWGAGVAVRPLSLWWPHARWLSFTADASANSTQATWENVGAKLAWEGSELRVWYDLVARSPGLEATVSVGASETSVSGDRVGEALRIPTKTPDLTAFGPVVLKLKLPGTLPSSPVPPPLFGAPRPSLSSVLAVLERAARDPRVVAVAFEDPPAVGGLAAAEDLRGAIDRLHAAGKKVYAFADDYDDGLGFQGWVSAADRVSLAPTGTLIVTAGESRRLYLKGFFDKIGVQFVNFAPWDTKSYYNTLTDSSMPDGERAMLTRYLTDRDALASSGLKSGRGGRLKGDAAAAVAEGPYLVASEALSRGLVDALESRAGFAEFLKRTHPWAQVVDDIPASRLGDWGPPVTGRTVALVHLSGDIIPGNGQAGRSIGQRAVEALAALRKDVSIRAVVLRVDSPGGAVTPSDALADEVRATVAAGKPVVVVMGDVAASGGYYLSAPATRIFARPGTLTGSIGVTGVWFTAEKTLDLLGIKADGVDMAPSSTFGDWTRTLTPATTGKWSAMIQSTYQRFLDVVAAGRHLDKDKLEPLARGQIYTGREALALGLVDELGGMTEARAWLEERLGGPVEFRDVMPGDIDFLGGLLAPFFTAAVKSSDSPTLKLATALDHWSEPFAEALSGVAARGPGPLVWVDVP